MPEQKDSLGEFLDSCDLVKFAKYEPGEPELRELHDSALRLVEETEPQNVKSELPIRRIAGSEPPNWSKSQIANRKSKSE